MPSQKALPTKLMLVDISIVNPLLFFPRNFPSSFILNEDIFQSLVKIFKFQFLNMNLTFSLFSQTLYHLYEEIILV